MGLLSRLGLFNRAAEEEPEPAARASEQEALRLIDRGNGEEQQGRNAEALELYEAATRVSPGLARAHVNRGNALLALDRTGEALDAYSAAIDRSPDYPSAHYNLGNARLRLGQRDAALSSYRKALALKPDFVDAEVAMGCVLEDLGQHTEAATCYRRALAINPEYAEVHGNLGHVLKNLGLLDEAVASYREALRIKPGRAAVHKGLAAALKGLRQFDAAMSCYLDVLRSDPADVEALVELGNILVFVGRIQDAITIYRRVLESKPDLAEVHTGLGNALTFLSLHDQALESHRRALEINSQFAAAHSNLANTLYSLGRLDEAATSYRRAIELQPDFATAYSGLFFTLSHNEAVGPEELIAEHRRFGEQFDAPAGMSPTAHVRDPDRSLRIGFVSADLRGHPIASFIEPLLAHLAGYPALSLVAYHNHATEDDVTSRLRCYFKQWHPVFTHSDAALAEKIKEDGIDILIDLSGHTAGNRLLTFARKPAPVQASWMGYPGTTGLRSMDYYFADPCFLPISKFAGQFTEKLVLLPANAPFLPDEGGPQVGRLPALGNGYLTFGSFNRLSKLRPAVISLWARLLRRLPNARMLLGGMPTDGQYHGLIDWFAHEGIARERLAFHPRCGTATYLALHHGVDICLDSYPYAGGTTTAHALWMGVPTLTLAGSTPPSRQGAAILGHADLRAFIAHDAEDFEWKGLHWAAHLSELAELRAGLRDRCDQSMFQHPEIIAAGLERALRTMWQRWCAGLPTEAFEVSLPIAGSTMPMAAARFQRG